MLPRPEAVDPGRDRVLVAADLLERERRAPAVVAERLHLDLVPLPVVRAGAAPAQHGANLVVAVGEGIGLDDHPVADDPLDREAAVVDARRDVLDDRSAAAVELEVGHFRTGFALARGLAGAAWRGSA